MDLYKAAYVCVCFLLSKKNIRQTSFIQLIIKESHFKISCACFPIPCFGKPRYCHCHLIVLQNVKMQQSK